MKGIEVSKEFTQRLRERQGGAKERALGMRQNTLLEAKELLRDLTERDKLILLLGLYWGEGTKKDFGIINSDPHLIQTFIFCLGSIGINSDRLTISIRIHSDVDLDAAKSFWISKTNLPENSIRGIEIIEGKKKGKLKYGMCRVRVSSGIRERLLVQTMISLIGKESDYRLVSQITPS